MKKENRDILEALLNEELALKNCGEPYGQILIASCNAAIAHDDFYRLRNLERKSDA